LWLQALQDHVVCPFDLLVQFWVDNSRQVYMNIVVFAEVEEFLPRELGAAVGDDPVGYAEALNNVGEERYRLL
jgi:hypothetical protein